MVNAIEHAMGIHTESLKRLSGYRGVYRRGAEEIELTGIPGRAGSVGDLIEDVPAIDIDAEWLFDPDDLRFGTERFLPKEKDQWIVEIKGQKIKFLILPGSQTDDAYSWSNGFRSLLRVSTKSRGLVSG